MRELSAEPRARFDRAEPLEPIPPRIAAPLELGEQHLEPDEGTVTRAEYRARATSRSRA